MVVIEEKGEWLGNAVMSNHGQLEGVFLGIDLWAGGSSNARNNEIIG